MTTRAGSPACALAAIVGACAPGCAGRAPDPNPGNDPPVVVSATPPVWSLVPAQADGEQTFTLTLADNDPLDTLQVRWMANYPPATFDTRVLGTATLPGGGSITRMSVTQVVDCTFSALPAGLKEHRIVAIISDRPFLMPGQEGFSIISPYESIPPEANELTVGWLLQKECTP